MQNKLFKLFFLICLVAVASSAALNAQQTRTFTGTVFDESNAALPGATIVVKGTTIGTNSGADGSFAIQVPEGSNILEVSFIGMEPQEVTITPGVPIRITMVTTQSMLNEVVVIGYGTAKRSEVTSAISSVSNEEIKNLTVTGADQALQG